MRALHRARAPIRHSSQQLEAARLVPSCGAACAVYIPAEGRWFVLVGMDLLQDSFLLPSVIFRGWVQIELFPACS